jgi:hypothetical protein
MATLSKIVDVISAVEGVDPERVASIARVVREAGLIVTGGRGTSAARMSEQDATNLLIAVNATETARVAPDVVARYRGLEAKRNKRTTVFGAQVEQAILAAGSGRLPEYLVGLVHDFGSPRNLLARRQFPQEDYALRIRIEFEKPEPSALTQVSVEFPLSIETILFRGRRQDQQSNTDRKDRITITHRTLIAIGRALQES